MTTLDKVDNEILALITSTLRAIAPDAELGPGSLRPEASFGKSELREFDSIQAAWLIGIIEDIAAFQFSDADISTVRTVGDIVGVVRARATRPIVPPLGGWESHPAFPRPVTAADHLKDQQRAQEVFATSRRLLSGEHSTSNPGPRSKVIGFMLERDEGCDATISPTCFEVQFGWLGHRCRYTNGPLVLAQLIELAGLSAPITAVVAPIQPSHANEGNWGPRTLWLQDDGDVIRIAIRARKNPSEQSAWPAPVQPPDE